MLKNALSDFLPRDRTRVPAVTQSSQAITETTHVVFRQSPVTARKQDQAKEWGRLHSIQDDRLTRVKAQPTAFKIPGDALSPLFELLPAVVKQREVIHVAQLRHADLQDYLQATASQLTCHDCGTRLNGVDSLHIGFKQVLWKDDEVCEQSGLYGANFFFQSEFAQRR